MFNRTSASSATPTPTFTAPAHIKLRLLPGEHTQKEVPPFLYMHVMKDIKFLLELVTRTPEPINTTDEDMPAVDLRICYLDELVRKCRKFDYKMMPQAEQYFKDKQYFDAFGNIHGSFKDVVIHAFEGEGLTMKFVDPEAPEVPEINNQSSITQTI